MRAEFIFSYIMCCNILLFESPIRVNFTLSLNFYLHFSTHLISPEVADAVNSRISHFLNNYPQLFLSLCSFSPSSILSLNLFSFSHFFLYLTRILSSLPHVYRYSFCYLLPRPLCLARSFTFFVRFWPKGLYLPTWQLLLRMYLILLLLPLFWAFSIMFILLCMCVCVWVWVCVCVRLFVSIHLTVMEFLSLCVLLFSSFCLCYSVPV